MKKKDAIDRQRFFVNKYKRNCITIRKKLLLQCPPLNRITLGQLKIDNNNRMIQLTDVFCELFSYITGSLISDYYKRLIQLSVIQLSGGHCNTNMLFCHQ